MNPMADHDDSPPTRTRADFLRGAGAAIAVTTLAPGCEETFKEWQDEYSGDQTSHPEPEQADPDVFPMAHEHKLEQKSMSMLTESQMESYQRLHDLYEETAQWYDPSDDRKDAMAIFDKEVERVKRRHLEDRLSPEQRKKLNREDRTLIIGRLLANAIRGTNKALILAVVKADPDDAKRIKFRYSEQPHLHGKRPHPVPLLLLLEELHNSTGLDDTLGSHWATQSLHSIKAAYHQIGHYRQL